MKRRRKNVVGNSFEQLEEKRLLAADVVMGDVNNDGSVNFQDFTVLSGHFGKTDAEWEHGDCSGNRIVGFEDFLMMAGNFGFSRGERPNGVGRPEGVEGGPGQRPEGVGRPDVAGERAHDGQPAVTGRPDGVEGGPGLRPEGVGRPGGGFQGGRPDNAEGGANREARVQATVDRLRAAIESGNLPEGTTAEQVNERIAVLENALATGERPEGEKPENIDRPTRGGRPDGIGGRFRGGRPDNVEGGANRESRVQATIDRLRAAIESGDLPEGTTAEQVNERIAALENALVTGERPEGERPDDVGRRPGGRFQGGRPDNAEGSANREARVQATIDRIRAAIESGNLPEGVTAEQAAERIAALENALDAGERPDGQRPEGIAGRPNWSQGRPNGRRPF